MRPPTEGRLIRLRAREPEDVPVLHAWAQDPDTIRFNESRYPPSLQAMRPRAELHPTYDHARLAVVDRESGALVGDVALHTMDPESRSGFIGLLIGPEHRGRGYGTDATRAICRFGFDMMNLHRIELDVYAENARAIRCYEKVGYQMEGRLRDAVFKFGKYQDILRMSVLEGELT